MRNPHSCPLRCNEINFRLESEFLSVSVDRRRFIHRSSGCSSFTLQVLQPKIGSSEFALKSSIASSIVSAIRSFSWMTRSFLGPALLALARSELSASKIESSFASNFSRAGWVSFASALGQFNPSARPSCCCSSTQRSFSSQFWSTFRRRTGYLLSLCSDHALVALDRINRTVVLPTRSGHMPCYSEFRGAMQ